jgi:hypothetical protein
MPGGAEDKFDFFLSRRGSVATVAQEVADVLNRKGYKVFVQDYDISLGASFIEAMHEAIKNSRDLVVLFTRDYEGSPYTRKELSSFQAELLQGRQDRHIVVLRCEDVPLRGLLADCVYQDLVGIAEPQERERLIIAAAERHPSAQRPQRRKGRTFVDVPRPIAGFTGRSGELDRLDVILTQAKTAAVTQVGLVTVHAWAGLERPRLRLNMPTDSATSMTVSGGVRRKRVPPSWPVSLRSRRNLRSYRPRTPTLRRPPRRHFVSSPSSEKFGSSSMITQRSQKRLPISYLPLARAS